MGYYVNQILKRKQYMRWYVKISKIKKYIGYCVNQNIKNNNYMGNRVNNNIKNNEYVWCYVNQII